ncbi:hypothetical protein NDU88_001836 [Pleurodeles waltl]|uniref:Uncharacterized protein n=1 Tax=Pleurodeles waltl TaxID=8319 RepID=A0AAV7U981_PLEWA|nr:hypothetical protein NDU88_001836 [Pleurodeles waltl]
MQLQKKRVRSCSTLQDTHAPVPVCLFRKSVSARDGTQLQRKRERSHQSQNQAIENDACQLHAQRTARMKMLAGRQHSWEHRVPLLSASLKLNRVREAVARVSFWGIKMKSWVGNVAEEVGSTNGLVDQMQIDTSMKKEVQKWYWLMLDIVDGEFNLLEEN